MLVLIRGAGDLASGIALRLHHAHLSVVMTDLPQPTAIRRTVCFSQAIVYGSMTVEDVTARFCAAPENAAAILAADVVVDAILAKKNLGTRITDAPCVIGVGPGFTAGEDCHAAVETMRGHTLGRALYHGSPLPNTNIPGLIGGFAGERVLRAPSDGIFVQKLKIGASVRTGDIAGTVNGVPMLCQIDGMLRGILPDGTPVTRGMKSGDVDPRGKREYCDLVSDKALAIGGGVLEAILSLTGALRA